MSTPPKLRRCLLLISLLASVLLTPAAHAADGPVLEWSASSSRSPAEALDGARVSGTIYPFLGTGGQGDVEKVTFTLDGALVKHEYTFPFDVKALDTTALADGVHEFAASVTHTDGLVSKVTAGFTVENSDAETPGPSQPSPGDDLADAPTFHVDAAAASGGDGTAERPFATIQAALDRARAGDVIQVAPGTYRERLRSVRAGDADAPIVITGPATSGADSSGPDAIIRGDGDGRQIQLDHDHITVRNLEIRSADILVWVQQARGVRLIGNDLHDAEGECIRLKYHAQENEIADNTIRACGRSGFDLARGKKNGEGVYIGTAPEQLYKNPTSEPDRSDRNWVHDNRFDTQAAECVDVKESSVGNLIERNDCRGTLDPESAGLGSRGDYTVFRDNVSVGNAGAGVRLGGDEQDQGVHNVVVGNVLTDNAGYGVKVMRTPQGAICGNVVARNGLGDTKVAAYQPAAPCS